MELLRDRLRPLAQRTALAAALGALFVPATASAVTADAAKSGKKRTPTVRSVSPMSASIGETITIRGRYFKRGRNKNSVVFKRDGGRAVFVKADVGTRKLLKVKLSSKLADSLIVRNGAPVATRFRIRVLAERLGRRFTSASNSPEIGPELPPAPPVPPASQPDGDCDGDGVLNRDDTDDDGDLLRDDVEKSLRLDGCLVDTDDDGVEDGYEYQSAQDLNDDEHQEPNQSLPYPDKRPYPNPLDKSDAAIDHDGDTLTLIEEQSLWKFAISQGAPHDLSQLAYSAGEQYTKSARAAGGRRSPTLAAAGYDKQASFLAWATGAGYATVALAAPGTDWYETRQPYDIRDLNRSRGVSAAEASYYDNGNGWLSDAERDEDADGLSNFDETRGCTNRNYWNKLYDKETPYYLEFGPTQLDDADTDGDGVRDGADDQDHDDLPNLMECSRQAASGQPMDARPSLTEPPVRPASAAIGFLNPYNPCLPSTTSRTCNRYPTFDAPWAPYNDKDKYFYIWN